jgi:hypothetical protein
MRATRSYDQRERPADVASLWVLFVSGGARVFREMGSSDSTVDEVPIEREFDCYCYCYCYCE